MGADARLAELGLTLPTVVPPLAAYRPTARTGDLVFTAGQLPVRSGEMVATGKLGAGVTEEQGQHRAQGVDRHQLPAVGPEVVEHQRLVVERNRRHLVFPLGHGSHPTRARPGAARRPPVV